MKLDRDEDWLHGKDGHIKTGDLILRTWQHRLPLTGWVHSGRWGQRLDEKDDVRSYRKPKGEGCACPRCQASQVAIPSPKGVAPEDIMQAVAVEAKKNDAGKPRLDLVPRAYVYAAARALTFGATKYGEKNYLKSGGLDEKRVIAALLRHVFAHNDGELLDSESGLEHLDHCAASLAMLLDIRSKRGL